MAFVKYVPLPRL